MSNYNEIVAKLYSGEKLTEREIRTLVWDSKQMAEIEGDKRRWTQDMRTIVDLNGELWEIDWESGLTEYQEDYYDHQPYRVEEHTRTITTTVTEYVPIKEN